MIHFRDDNGPHELLVVAYLQSAGGARFIFMAGWPFRPLTAANDRGASYQIGYRGRPGSRGSSGCTRARRTEIRWLDLSPAPGEPATRIELSSAPASPPEITVTPAAVEPGELLLADIAAGLLALASPEQVPLHPSAGRPGPLSEATDGLADIIAALQAAGALTPSSRLPGQLAGLCTRLGISGHGLAAPPLEDLPEPWLSLLAYCQRGKPERAPVPDWAVTAIELPELDGARITVLGLHNGQRGQFLHLLASGVTPEYTWSYGMIDDRMPVVWLRDPNGRWHATRTRQSGQLRNTDDSMLLLRIVPPLDHGTPQVDVVVAGPSAEVRATVPLWWK